jgi:hypothetical protein
MPYTQEELQSLTWYQNLIDEDEQQYLQNKNLLLQQAALSGSADNGSLLVRDENNAILLFENPYTNIIPQDPSTNYIHSLTVGKLKDDESSVNNILDRNFEEL